MRKFLKFFGGSILFTLVALALAFYVGYFFEGSVLAGLTALFTALMLGALETSLSFDNAVVNARILETMSPFWRRIFLTIGIIIAVFGMRIIFPLVIVWAVGGVGFTEVLRMTWQEPQRFQDILIAQHVVIAGFGGAFLWMVFAKFFFDEEKDVHWVGWIEAKMTRLSGRVDALPVFIALIATLLAFLFVSVSHRADFLVAAVMGIVLNIVVEGISSLLESGEEKAVHGGTKVAAAGLGSFLYLEVLDASFSFDGVIGAFAITNNLYLIALGLGIGAMFVRSLTVKLVVDRTLTTYRYLEHGAFWAIGCLSAIMYVSAAGIEVPTVVSGSLGILFIAASLLWSRFANSKVNLADGRD